MSTTSFKSSQSRSSISDDSQRSGYRTSSSRRRLQRSKVLGEPRAPPAKMSGFERLQLIRNAITRLQHVCERALHMITLDQAGGEAIDKFFAKLYEKAAQWQYNPNKLGSVESSAPRHLHFLAKELGRVKSSAEELVSILEAEGSSEECVYSGLKHRLLQDALLNLTELGDLLRHRQGGDMSSRISTDLLQDQVAFHIDDFDAFTETHLRLLAQEMMNEGVVFTAPVMSDPSQRATPVGIFSVVLLDVAVGVRPGRSARMVLEHAKQNLVKIENRISACENLLNVLREGDSKADSTAPNDPNVLAATLDKENQLQEYRIMLHSVRQTLIEVDQLRQRWEREEEDIFNLAASNDHNLIVLLKTKFLKETEIIEGVQALHDAAIHTCLPFASPQYHRRHSETYGQPCHVRIALHFASSARPPLRLYTVNPQFLPLMAQLKIGPAAHQQYSYLVPSKDQLWLTFSELPEMVKGARCALRGRHSKANHIRAGEEMKELGGYFIMRGGERILRALLMQRCNVALNITRNRFEAQGSNFSSKAVLIRSKRPSGTTVQNYFYYTSVGEVVFSFARKVIWHIPVSLLLFATSTDNVSSLELFRLLTIGMPGGNHPARAEAFLQHHQKKPYSNFTNHLDFMSVIGRMYREYHQKSTTFHFLPQFARSVAPCQHDAWYGMFLLRRHLLPHLNNDLATPDLSPAADAETLQRWLPAKLMDELNKKFDALVAITRQLYLFIDDKVAHQGNDVLAYQELFTVSQVLVGTFNVCLSRFFKIFALHFGRHMPATLLHSVLTELPNMKVCEAADVIRQLKEYTFYSAKHSVTEPLEPLNRLLIVGNLNLDREEDFYCPQNAGWVVMAEHLNFFRFFEQLRCVHRGRTIAGMRSSEVRKYPCESFGFICMVHSPDGEDCGVVNHLSVSTIMSNACDAYSLTAQKTQLDACIQESLPPLRNRHQRSSLIEQFIETVPVWLEGELVGYATEADAARAADVLRLRKVLDQRSSVGVHGVVRRRDVSVLQTLEVVYVAAGCKDPKGLYVFYGSGRLMRPIQRIEGTAATSLLLSHHPHARHYDRGAADASASAQRTELPFPLVYVGTWEQTWLDIASVPSDLLDAVTQLNRKYAYMEQCGTNLLSLTSTTIPFFEFNCSPRNLFQCGLTKQSAGTQLQALSWRKEAKLFRMYCPQRYISRTLPMDLYGLDDVNLGVNAVVAILAYTGYDMDDAIIINSTATQLGMLNAGVTVAKIVTASGRGDKDDVFVFHNVLDQDAGERFSTELRPNGLPFFRRNADTVNFDTTDHSYPGLQDTSAVYCCAKRTERLNPFTNQREYEYTQHQVTKWRHFDKGEKAWVHQVIPLTYDGPDPTSALMIFRIPRPPAVGDKFASRHGQKGTLPLHIRSHDLPFSTQSGITPDVIINPHAFPSRMTVGMVLEIMAAKLGALQGRFMDNSAWSVVDEHPRVADIIGETLEKSGYNRYGRETLIDGISGEEMEVDVFMGISGYQRLRHMVNDKWQARARTDAYTYRAVTKTGQPVKGRKRHGGVRVGEMERDGLLSHGVSEIVVDRLMHVSDKTRAYICPQCGGLLSIYERYASEYATWKTCRFCGAGADEASDSIAMVEIPQVLRLWAAELTSIGIRVVLRTS